MSIKPIDFQVAIPRSMEASKVSSNDANKNLAMQQQNADSIQHKAETDLRQVNSRTKPEEAKITEKQKENRKNSKKNSSNKKEAEDGKKKDLNKEMQTSIIDIKI